MEQNIENLLRLVADTEAIEHNDELSELINAELNSAADSELSLDDLDMVSAAGKSDYDKFKSFLDKKGIKY